MIHEDNDYGYYWDIENSREIINNCENTNIYEEDSEDDPYLEYLDRYEQHLRYEDNQLQEIYYQNYKPTSIMVFLVSLLKHYFK